MPEVEIVSVAYLQPGDTIILRDGDLCEFRSATFSDGGWAVAVFYMPDKVERALMPADLRVARVL